LSIAQLPHLLDRIRLATPDTVVPQFE
jgi:hypothetical protein